MRKKRSPLCLYTALVLAAAAISACLPVDGTLPAPPPTIEVLTQTFPLATPVSQEPAAGICASFDDRLAAVTINPDIPDPRCARVTPDQMLKVINRTGGKIQVHIGAYQAALEPGGEHIFDVPFGEYLAPGVHNVQVLPCCGPELWLENFE